MRQRKELAHGLRQKALRRRLKEQQIDDNAAGSHSHALAVAAHRDWLRRRVTEAIAKAGDKPVAAELLAKLQKRAAEPECLSRREILLLMVIENRLAKGEDVKEQAARPRHLLPSKRPEWMRDRSLLPKRPPGR